MEHNDGEPLAFLANEQPHVVAYGNESLDRLCGDQAQPSQ